MLHPVKGIVLRCVRYGDTSVITKVYTDKFGVQSYLINGVRAAKSRSRQALLQPLTLLNMVVYHREHKNLQRVREMTFDHVFTHVPFNIARSSVAMFVTEVLNKTLKEEAANPDLFQFLHEAILNLDSDDFAPDFHVYFLARLSQLLGFAPANHWSAGHRFFDLEGGNFVEEEPVHYHVVETEDARAFSILFRQQQVEHEAFSKAQRLRLLDDLLLFYRLHIEGFGKLKSYKVLQAILN